MGVQAAAVPVDCRCVSIVMQADDGPPEIKVSIDIKFGVAELVQVLWEVLEASGKGSISQDIVPPKPKANAGRAHQTSAKPPVIIYDNSGPSAPPPPPPPLPPAGPCPARRESDGMLDEFFANIDRDERRRSPPNDWSEPVFSASRDADLQQKRWNDSAKLKLRDETESLNLQIISDYVARGLQHKPPKAKEPTPEIDVVAMQAVEVRAERMKAMIPEETIETARQALKVRVERMKAMETMNTMNTKSNETTMKPMQAMQNDRTKEAQEIREDCPPSDEEHDGRECKYQ